MSTPRNHKVRSTDVCSIFAMLLELPININVWLTTCNKEFCSALIAWVVQYNEWSMMNEWRMKRWELKQSFFTLCIVIFLLLLFIRWPWDMYKLCLHWRFLILLPVTSNFLCRENWEVKQAYKKALFPKLYLRFQLTRVVPDCTHN